MDDKPQVIYSEPFIVNSNTDETMQCPSEFALWFSAVWRLSTVPEVAAPTEGEKC